MPLVRPLVLLPMTLAALAVLAIPAWAHASFDIRQVPVGTSTGVELRVPIETDAGNAFVDVLVPGGWTVDDCAGADGWRCDVAPRDDGAIVVNLAAETPAAGAAELFLLELTTPDAQGTYTFPVVQTYDDGTEAAWVGEPGTDRPAPRIQVGDDDTVIERSTELPTHGDIAVDVGATVTPTPTAGPEPTAQATPTPSPSPSATPSEAPADDLASEDATATPSETVEPSPIAAPDDSGGVPVAVWIVALMVLGGAAAAAFVRRRA